MAELIWDGKYDEHGNKRAPVRIELPFQTVETVNESVQERQRTLELSSSGNDPEWRNRLIWGDKKYVLPSLLPEFAGKVDLIYIDPPFDTGADFSFTASIPARSTTGDEVTFVKEASILEQKAYRDTWGRGMESYLQWFYETAVLLRELLADDGSIYVHLDWHVGGYAKVILDEIFPGSFRNEIVWKRDAAGKGAKTISRQWPRVFDSILFYTKTDNYHFEQQFSALTDLQIKEYRYQDPGGRRFKRTTLGDYTADSIAELAKNNLIYTSSSGQEYKKYYLDEGKVTIDSIWADIFGFGVITSSKERVGYATQKPESLIERIVKASSNQNDLVLDCFCGSGTTAAVAEKLNRRWIACDLGRFAIHTTRKRLLGIPGVKPFVVQNLGKYERQQWQVAEFAPSPVILSGVNAPQSGAFTESKDPASAGSQQRPDREFSRDRGGNASPGLSSQPAGAGSFDSAVGSPSRTNRSAQDDRLREQRQREAAYRMFILELYHATPVSGHVWLHGVKAGRMVHVGAVDAPVTRADVNAIAAEVWKASGKGPNSPQKPAVDVLGWEFALELNETAKEIAAQARVDSAFKKIPREVLEKKAVEQGDVQFFELGALSVDTRVKKRELTLELSKFIIPLDDVPAEVRGAIKHWSQMVDYWAVDWDFKDDTFHNQWQSYRTRKNPKLELTVKHEYAEPGEYTVVVKVIDILGNDTTKTLTVNMK